MPFFGTRRLKITFTLTIKFNANIGLCVYKFVFRRFWPQPELSIAGRDEQVPLRLHAAHGRPDQRLLARRQCHLPGEIIIILWGGFALVNLHCSHFVKLILYYFTILFLSNWNFVINLWVAHCTNRFMLVFQAYIECHRS